MSNIYEALQKSGKQHQQTDADVPIQSTTVSDRKKSVTSAASQVREFSSLYQSIIHLLAGHQSKIVSFISVHGKAGTSTICYELARIASHDLGNEVLLINADRDAATARPGTRDPVLENFLGRGVPVADCVAKDETDGIARAFLATGGSGDPVIPKFVSDASLWAALRETFHFIIIDNAPLSKSEDGLVLSALADGVVVVLEAEVTRPGAARDAIQRLRERGGTVLGTVLNRRRFYIPAWIYRRL